MSEFDVKLCYIGLCNSNRVNSELHISKESEYLSMHRKTKGKEEWGRGSG